MSQTRGGGGGGGSVLRTSAVRVNIFSTGGKFRPDYVYLHALTQVACSYALL